MEMPRLEIEQQRAQISIDIQQAQLHVDMPERKMVINWEPPRMEIHRRSGSVSIDTEELKSNLGLKNYDELNKVAASKAQAIATQATKETVNTAAFVGDVAVHGPKVGEAAKSKMLESVDASPGRSPVPPDVGMEGKPGTMEVEWTKGGISIEWEGGGLADVYVEPPWSVEIRLTQRPVVRVSLAEESIPPAAGRNVSTQA